MNFTQTILFDENGIRSCSVPMYDPAIWLADVRLRGNSEEIGMLLEVVHNDATRTMMTSTTICIYEDAGNVSEVNADVFSTLENELESIMRLIVIR